MEENNNPTNKNKSFIIIFVLFAIAIAFCGGYYYSQIMKGNNELNNNENVNTNTNSTSTTTKPTVNTNIKGKGIIADYVCKGLDSDTKRREYQINDITLKTFNDNKSQFTLLFKDGDYEIYKDKCANGAGIEEICHYNDNIFARNYDGYYAYNTKKNRFYNSLAENDWEGSNTEYYYELVDSVAEEEGTDYNLPILNLKEKIVIDGYTILSCDFHSDIQFNTCRKSNTIIVTNMVESSNAYDSDRYGLISLKDKTEILKPTYNHISEDNNGNFLVENDNKMGIYSSTGKELLKLEYDYIGYNEYLGYITIKGENIKVFDNNINAVEIDEKTLETAFVSILDAKNECDQSMVDTEKKNYLYLTNPDSYLWGAGSLITKQDVSKPYYDSFVDEEENAYRFKYTGKTYTGEKLIIYSYNKGCAGKPLMYILDGTKAHKISTKEISIKKNEKGNMAAFCF